MRSDDGLKGATPELIDLIGGRLEVVARMGSGVADTVLFRGQMEAGKLVPLHNHIDPECFYVLSGRIEIFVADNTPRWRTVEAGRSLLVADSLNHSVRNAADQPADLVVATNGRLARFFREAGRPGTAGLDVLSPTPEDIQRFIRVSEAYGYWIASPAESAAMTG